MCALLYTKLRAGDKAPLPFKIGKTRNYRIVATP